MIELIAQFPPEMVRILRPQQDPESPLFQFRAASPLEIHSCKPTQALEKFFAKSGLQPGVILFSQVGRTSPSGLPPAIATQSVPGIAAAGQFHAAFDELARFARQRQMRALARGGHLAEGTTALANHTFCLSVQPGRTLL